MLAETKKMPIAKTRKMTAVEHHQNWALVVIEGFLSTFRKATK